MGSPNRSRNLRYKRPATADPWTTGAEEASAAQPRVTQGSAVFSILGWESLCAEGDISYTWLFYLMSAPLAPKLFKGQVYMQLHTKSSTTCSQDENNR